MFYGTSTLGPLILQGFVTVVELDFVLTSRFQPIICGSGAIDHQRVRVLTRPPLTALSPTTRETDSASEHVFQVGTRKI